MKLIEKVSLFFILSACLYTICSHLTVEYNALVKGYIPWTYIARMLPALYMFFRLPQMIFHLFGLAKGKWHYEFESRGGRYTSEPLDIYGILLTSILAITGN